MSEEQFGLTNSGDGVVQVPVELKDHSKDPVLTEPDKVVEKKKRGRPAKKAKVVREYYCSTCRTRYDDLTVMKVGAGAGRYAIFCPEDQKSLGFSDTVADEKLAQLHKNPNKK